MSAISIQGIQKSYDKTQALKGINLEVKEGELFGLIGPDGAGKTSLIRILATLILAEEGRAEVLGYEVVKDYKEVRKRMGYMPGRFSLYYDLSIEENISLFATIFGTTLEDNYELVKEIYDQIEPFKHRRAGQLSGGMKQKLALCCALIHAPQILFLDEPTTGVDAVSRREFWDMLKRLKEKGITILVSTPYMDEAGLCDRVALIQEGEIMEVDKPTEIEKAYPRELYGIRTPQTYKLLNDLKEYPHSASVYGFGASVHYSDNREDFDPIELRDWLQNRGHEEVEVTPIKANIEDCFMELMSKKALEQTSVV